MTKIKDIVAASGTYQDRDGNEKKNWVNVGKFITKEDGGQFIVLNAHVNLAGLIRGERGDVMCSLFEQKPKQGNQDSHSQAKANAFQAQSGGAIQDNDIPW